MTESIQLESKLADIINCPVCSRILYDAKLLPCGHSSCLKCLEELASEQDVGETRHMACPQCNRRFAVPNGGLQCIPENLYVEALLQIKDMSMSSGPGSGDQFIPTADDREASPVSEKNIKLSRCSAKTSVEGCGTHTCSDPETTNCTATSITVNLHALEILEQQTSAMLANTEVFIASITFYKYLTYKFFEVGVFI